MRERGEADETFVRVICGKMDDMADQICPEIEFVASSALLNVLHDV